MAGDAGAWAHLGVTDGGYGAGWDGYAQHIIQGGTIVSPALLAPSVMLVLAAQQTDEVLAIVVCAPLQTGENLPRLPRPALMYSSR